VGRRGFGLADEGLRLLILGLEGVEGTQRAPELGPRDFAPLRRLAAARAREKSGHVAVPWVMERRRAEMNQARG
jgi:hypothetical protein